MAPVLANQVVPGNARPRPALAQPGAAQVALQPATRPVRERQIAAKNSRPHARNRLAAPNFGTDRTRLRLALAPRPSAWNGSAKRSAKQTPRPRRRRWQSALRLLPGLDRSTG